MTQRERQALAEKAQHLELPGIIMRTRDGIYLQDSDGHRLYLGRTVQEAGIRLNQERKNAKENHHPA